MDFEAEIRTIGLRLSNLENEVHGLSSYRVENLEKGLKGLADRVVDNGCKTEEVDMRLDELDKRIFALALRDR